MFRASCTILNCVPGLTNLMVPSRQKALKSIFHKVSTKASFVINGFQYTYDNHGTEWI